MKVKIVRKNEKFSEVIYSYNGKIYFTSKEKFEMFKPDNIKFFEYYCSEHISNAFSSPITVQIQTTNACNLRCKHCYVSSGKKDFGEMSNSDIHKILIMLRSSGVLKIEWVGGEVFMKKNFIELLRKANELGFEQSILSNGLFFAKNIRTDILKEILSYVFLIQISADDYGDKYDEFVGSDGAWGLLKKSIKTLSKLKDEHTKISIAIIIRKDNICSIENIVNEFHEDVDYFRTGKEIPMGRSLATKKESDKSLFESYDIVKKISDRGVNINHPFFKEVSNTERILPFEFDDIGARSYMYITSTGDCYPFPLLYGMNEYNGGNIFKKSINEIWTSKAFKKYRKPTRSSTGCDKCELLCQMWPRYHNIFGNSLDNEFEKPIKHPGCNSWKKSIFFIDFYY